MQSLETNADKTSLNLKAGQVYTNIKGKLNPGAKYEIRTPTAVMGVRGTQFFVSLDSGGQAKVVTVEGNVFVTVPQEITLEDGTTVTQDVEIEVQPNQIFVQTGDITDPGRYDLETLTGDAELSLFVLETLQEISAQQPDLINPEILQNLEERIEKARQEQQEQERQQERQQQELVQNIQYDNNTRSESDTGTGGPPATDPGNDDEDLPEIKITTHLEDIYLQFGDELPWMCFIETVPAEDVELEVEVEDESIAEASFDGNDLFIYGLELGSTTVTVTASKEGYRPAEASFTVTVYEEEYQEGDWDRSIIDVGDEISHTDIALDSRGIPHIIYDTYKMKYQHWNSSYWQEEERWASGRQGSLTIVTDSYGNDYSLVSYNDGGELGYDVFDGRNWHYLGFGYEQNEDDKEVSVGASSTNITPYFNDYWGQVRYGAGISYYDEANGDLYFRFNKYPENNRYEDWSAPFLVDGKNGDAGKSSSLAFSYDFLAKDGKAYIAYYDDSNGGSLKLAVISDPLATNPQDIEIIEIDDQVGYGAEGQYVSLAVDNQANVLHLAYYDANQKELKYAQVAISDWIIEKDTIDNEGDDVGKYASLALDREGIPHIIYYAQNESGGALKYAYGDSNNEGDWLIEVVDRGEEVGSYSSIAVYNLSIEFENDLSIPHIAYTAKIGEDWIVKHATRKDVMNAIEPNVLSGTEQAFEDEAFYIENFGNEICDVWRETGEEVEKLKINEDYTLCEDEAGLIFTLKSDFLNNLPVTNGYEDPHRIWIKFDYGLPVIITIEVTENLEAFIVRDSQDVAYDPINNRYLMVYERDIVEYTYSEIWGRFISADGVLGPEFPISENTGCRYPKVVYNPKNYTFLVTWQNGGDYLIYAQILDDKGDPYGEKGNFAVCPEPETVYGQNAPAVAVNTETGFYLIAWDDQADEDNLKREIYGQLLDEDGNQVGGRLNLISMEDPQVEPVLAYSSAVNQYLLLYADTTEYYEYDVMGQMFGSDGDPVLGTILEIAVGKADQYTQALAVDDANERFLVVWHEYLESNIYNIFGRFINADDGTMEDDFAVYQSGQYQYRPSVALNTRDGSFLVAWEDDQDRLFARYFAADGTGMEDPVQIYPEGEELRNVKLVYNPVNNNYLAIYEDHSSFPTIIRCNILPAKPQL